MTLQTWPLQQALFQHLSNDAGLSALIGPRLYDEPPRTPKPADYPYVVFGDSSAAERADTVISGAEHRLTLTVYARAGGRGEVRRVLDALHSALEGARPLSADLRVITLSGAGQSVRTLSSGRIYAGTARFRIVTEPII